MLFAIVEYVIARGEGLPVPRTGSILLGSTSGKDEKQKKDRCKNEYFRSQSNEGEKTPMDITRYWEKY